MLPQYEDAVWRTDPAFAGRHFRDNKECHSYTTWPHSWCDSCREKWSKDPAYGAYFTVEGQVRFPERYGKEISISDWLGTEDSL
jgi:phage terminase large subunit-like protein